MVSTEWANPIYDLYADRGCIDFAVDWLVCARCAYCYMHNQCCWCNGTIAQFEIWYLFHYLAPNWKMFIDWYYCLLFYKRSFAVQFNSSKISVHFNYRSDSVVHKCCRIQTSHKKRVKENQTVWFRFLFIEKVTIMMMTCHLWQSTVKILLYLFENCH